MDETIVFEKTERGTREIAQPGGELQPKQRRILILLDGKRPLGDIALMTRPGEVGPIIETLLKGGYVIASGEGAGSISTRPGEAPGQGAGPAGFKQERLRAARAVEEILGPRGEPLAIEIERCGTPEQLRELVAKAQRVILQSHGAARAEAFANKAAAERK